MFLKLVYYDVSQLLLYLMQSSLPKKYRFMIMIWINGFEPVIEPETNRFFRVNHPIPEPILPDFFG